MPYVSNSTQYGSSKASVSKAIGAHCAQTKTNNQFNETKTSTARRYLTDSDHDRFLCFAVNRQSKMRDQFMRIAMARIRADYPFRLQRIAVAAKMWSRFTERKQQ
jgi:hypothetical protein